MQTCFVVPGLGASELLEASDPSRRLWIDISTIVLGRTTYFGLASDGVSPSPNGGVGCIAGGPVQELLGGTISLLQSQIGPQGWTVQGWGWDWRLSLFSAGNLLAAAITAAASAQSPCVVVGHSAGGLVARVAYSVLAAAGQAALIQRIITLGTPHQGSYCVVDLYCGQSGLLLGLASLAALVNFTLAGALIPFWPSATTIRQLLDVILTWPSIYQLLPTLGSPSQSTDPLRPVLFQAGNWHTEPLDQQWLSLSSDSFAPLLNGSSALPPAYALTTIAGTGLDTSNVLVQQPEYQSSNNTESTTAGDGAVTVQSALLPDSWQYVLNAAHTSLPGAVALSGLLAREVVALRGPQTPVPPESVSNGPFDYSLGAPPVPLVSFGAAPAAYLGPGDP